MTIYLGDYSYKVLDMTDGIHTLGSIKWDLVICLLVSFLVTFFGSFKGVKSSGKLVYLSVPLPYVLLTVLLVRGATLPGSLDGIKYYIIPDWTKMSQTKVGANLYRPSKNPFYDGEYFLIYITLICLQLKETGNERIT